MMMRAQKPLTLSVGPFYIMSTETALAVRIHQAFTVWYVLIRKCIFRFLELHTPALPC